MKIDTLVARELLRSFAFKELFIEQLGWDKNAGRLAVEVSGAFYFLHAIAHKRGFVVYECEALPDHGIRMRIDHEATKYAREHIIIYTDKATGSQVWSWVRREPGKPLAGRNHRYHISQHGDALLQRLEQIAVSLDEEEGLTIVDVTGRAREAFDVERVTKRFYERFRVEHDTFLGFVSGIPNSSHLRWYTSLMLNRLMFLYFIQKKGFLNGEIHYLRTRLADVQRLRGKDQFQTFYRYFLLRLFHEGLAKQAGHRKLDPQFEHLLGQVPYLNGGLFEVHQLEKHYDRIDIPDEAFSGLFRFFDDYAWHLDDRPLRTDHEINPDVIGYIFEQYVNQAQMGAYYTRDDVTEYVSANTILPYLLTELQHKCPHVFGGSAGRSAWDLLREDPDRYARADSFHPGSEVRDEDKERTDLPGLSALFSRYGDVRARLASGDVRSTDALVSLNVDLRQFVQDLVEGVDDAGFIEALWGILNSISVLDPTCGSGAFLMAAAKILEPLYEACLDRMLAFLEGADHSGGACSKTQESLFRRVLEQVTQHPSRRYFVLKTITLKNLYGVDIMEEAIEICRLRLFLKLVAQVDADPSAANLGLEPLPDIDFNIKTGNTLVGFVNLREAMQRYLDYEGIIKGVLERAARLQTAVDEFRTQQTMENPEMPASKKERIGEELLAIRSELDRYLAAQYEVTPGSASYQGWLRSHQPLHWCAEFFGIVTKGGFDVIIGNPPYVKHPSLDVDYDIRGYRTRACGNLWAYCVERSLALLQPKGWMSMLVQLSLTFSEDFVEIRRLLLNQAGYLRISNFDNIPDRLFTGAKQSDNTSKNNQQRISLLEFHRTEGRPRIETSPLVRWRSAERQFLFAELPHAEVTSLCSERGFPKVGTAKMRNFLQRMDESPLKLKETLSPYGRYGLVVPKTAGYYIAAYEDSLPRTQQMLLRFDTSRNRDLARVVLNSNCFFWWWRTHGDGFHVTAWQMERCPLPRTPDTRFVAISERLSEATESCTVYKGYRGKQVPNVNYNQRMDLLVEADRWIIENMAPDSGVSPLDFLWAKSSSFLCLQVAKVSE